MLFRSDPASPNYIDEALRLHTGADDPDKLVEAFADKIPHTHGAPVIGAPVVGVPVAGAVIPAEAAE